MNEIILIILPITIFLIAYLFKKYSILMSLTGDYHQKFAAKENVPLVGGIFILFGICFLFFNILNYQIIYFFLIFLLGFLSDYKILKSPKIRFFLQLIIIITFIISANLEINGTRILFLDNLLRNQYFHYLFILFCIMILVNGCNFIDGLNTLLIGYFILLSIFLYKLNLLQTTGLGSDLILQWIMILIFLYFFNFFRKIFMGDTGAYLLGLIYSFLTIKIYMNNPNISPYFIIVLLWYPCFEILFSILRKFKFKKSPIKPDTKHLHQLVFFYISKTFKINDNVNNTLSANLINFYNLLIFGIASLNINNSQLQIFILLISIFLYCYIYLKLFLFRYRRS